jgi:hypothetical protein
MSSKQRVIFSTETHSVSVWTVPNIHLGGKWNDVWFSVWSPTLTAAGHYGTVAGTDSAEYEEMFLAAMRREGHIPLS